MKSLVTSTLVALLCLVISNASPVLAATTTTTATDTDKKIPFHGKLTSVDKWKKTITLVGKTTTRVFYLTSETKITNGAGEPATLSDATPGEDVGGSYTKDASGKMTLHSVRFGAKTGDGDKDEDKDKEEKPETAAAPTPAPTAEPTPEPSAAAAVDTSKKYKFSGTVVSADSDSIVVHGKADVTYAITDATKITDSTGKTAKISAFKAGVKVSGSYTKAADGTTFTATLLKLSK